MSPEADNPAPDVLVPPPPPPDAPAAPIGVTCPVCGTSNVEKTCPVDGWTVPEVTP